ncbi:TetR-like C-terminal domain-containing protein [Streptomyces sp. B1866]|uniref:TetR-like C-terminal domain-containing protein n=1 Tax=Streptomyces sp. B1866 TaxID=3075431 RepID=UPI002890CE23|nr:TetR-like C-terminal domain-containing protein [Streptomyces sp. B1866]MDT3397313.1 TetR-like C-terminal domain-containing protein [Streptomyces sp. B1866]
MASSSQIVPQVAPRSRPAAARRRGRVLERAILDATLARLLAVGWKGLTIEGVAAAAQTGKAAVYRRWSSKADLVHDALRAGLPRSAPAPDHGTLREDLVGFCRGMREAMYSPSGAALRAVIHECDHADAARFSKLMEDEVLEPGKRLLREIVRRGAERGEARPDAVGPMTEDVVPALMIYRLKVCSMELTEQDAVAIVDEVMLPLLRDPAHAGAGDRVRAARGRGVM